MKRAAELASARPPAAGRGAGAGRLHRRRPAGPCSAPMPTACAPPTSRGCRAPSTCCWPRAELDAERRAGDAARRSPSRGCRCRARACTPASSTCRATKTGARPPAVGVEPPFRRAASTPGSGASRRCSDGRRATWRASYARELGGRRARGAAGAVGAGRPRRLRPRDRASSRRTLWRWLGGAGVLLLLAQTLLLRWGLAPLRRVAHEIRRDRRRRAGRDRGPLPGGDRRR